MNNKFEQLITRAKTVRMNAEDKAVVRARLTAYMQSRRPVKSPLSIMTTFSRASFFARSVAFVLVCLLVSGGTLSYASADALPGDILYPVKVKVKEEVEAKLAITTEAKIEVETKRIERRLNEVQTLLQENDTSPEKHKLAEVYMAEHVNAFTKDIKKLQEAGEVEAILTATSTLEPILKTHKKRIQEQQRSEEKERIVAKQEVQPEISTLSLSSEINPDNISNTSTLENGDPQAEIEVNIATTTEIITEETVTPEEQLAKEIPTEEIVESSFDSITSSLLATVESTLDSVKASENEALETIEQQISNEPEKEAEVISITENQVQEAEEKIKELQKDIIAPSTEITPTVDASITTSVEEISTTATTESTMVILPLDPITQANNLLIASKEAYARGSYTEALSLSQEAVKILRTIDEEKKLNARMPVETTPSQTPTKPVEQSTKSSIELEAQAKNAIQSLEAVFSKELVITTPLQ